jgi:replicative DNA helicase
MIATRDNQAALTGDADRPPPHNLAAEQAVLGALLVDSTLYGAVASIIGHDDFYQQTHQRVFLAIRTLVDANKPIDKVGLCEELSRRHDLQNVGGPEYIGSLLESVPTTAATEQYARIVQEKAIRRNLISAGHEIARLSWADDGCEIADTVGHTERIMRSATNRAGGDFAKGVDALMSPWLADLENRHLIPRLVLPYGALGDCLSGLQPECLYIMCARPGHMKTGMAVNIAAYIAKTEPVVYAALEEGTKPIIDRQVSNLTGIPKKKFRTGVFTDYEWAKIAEAAGEVAARKLTIVDNSPPLDTNQLRAALRRERAEGRCNIAIIDHARKLTDMGGFGNKTATYIIEDVCNSLERAAIELHIPIVLLVHLSKEADRTGANGPSAAQTADSDWYYKAATAQFALWRPSAYDEKFDKNLLKVRILKNRYGPEHVDFDFNCDFATDRIVAA